MLTFALGWTPGIVFLQRAPSLERLGLPNRQHLLHKCLSPQIKGKGKVSVGLFETLIVAQESLLQLSGDPGAGFQSLSEPRNLFRILLKARFPGLLLALMIPWVSSGLGLFQPPK